MTVLQSSKLSVLVVFCCLMMVFATKDKHHALAEERTSQKFLRSRNLFINVMVCCVVYDCNNPGGYGSRKPIVGYWKKTGVSGPDIELNMYYGTEINNGQEVTREVSDQITAQISTGFEYDGFSFGGSLSATTTSSIASTVSSSISTTKGTTTTVKCDDNSESATKLWSLWQWHMEQDNEDACGFTYSGFQTDTKDFVCTDSWEKPPLCPIGFCADLECQICKPFQEQSSEGITDVGGGTEWCGSGNTGNGQCEDGSCCSPYGWCGTSTEHCGASGGAIEEEGDFPTEAVQGEWCGNGNIGNGQCEDGSCCSAYGWCGTTAEHCSP